VQLCCCAPSLPSRCFPGTSGVCQYIWEAARKARGGSHATKWEMLTLCIELISYSSGPLLGDVESGAVAAAFTPRVSVLSGRIICVLGVGALALALPQFRRYDARHHQQPVHTRCLRARMPVCGRRPWRKPPAYL